MLIRPFRRPFLRPSVVVPAILLLVLLLLGIGLLVVPPAGAQAASTQAAGAQPPTSAEYTALYLAGADTIGAERVQMTDSAMLGDLRLRGQPRIEWTQLRREPPGRRTLRLRVWRPGAGEQEAPVQLLQLQVRGDSAYVYTMSPAGRPAAAPQAALASRAGAAWLVNQSLVHAAALAAESRAGDTLWVMLSAGAQLLPATVARGADTLSLVIAGLSSRYVLGADGALASAEVPAQRLSVRVLRGEAARSVRVPPSTVSYDAPAGAPYEALPVRIPTGMGHTLAGTLTRPRVRSAPVPVAVTISGSGAQERDEAIPGVEGYRLFRSVADTLGRRGIAVLRLDDRGVGESTGDFVSATSRDFADDVRAAVAWLRTRPDIDSTRIALVGHSEGGLVAPLVAADDTRLAAIALLAGPAYTGKRIIDFQQRSAIAQSHASSFASTRDSLFRVSQQALDSVARTSPWMREFLIYDPLPTAQRVRTPVLILQGERDLQVTAEQADSLAAAFRRGGNRDVTMHRLRNTNHLFQRDPSGLPAGYGALPDRQPTREAMGLLADWLAAKLQDDGR